MKISQWLRNLFHRRVPSVFLLAYNRGAPGKVPWTLAARNLSGELGE